MEAKDYLQVVNRDPDRKNWLRIGFEALHAGVIEREKPLHYFTNLLYRKGADNYQNYIGFRKAYNIIDNFYYPNGRNADLEDKMIFSEIAKANDIRTPLIVAINDKNKIHIDGDTFNIETYDGFLEILRKMLNPE